jgi:predicted helicase
VSHLIDAYNVDRKRLAGLKDSKQIAAALDESIKWTRAVKRDLQNGVQYSFDPQRVRVALYRPFVRRLLYFSPELNEMRNLMPQFFGDEIARNNPAIVLTDPTSQKPFMTVATDHCPDMHVVGAAAGGLVLPVSMESGDGITDWALKQFKDRYKVALAPQPLTSALPSVSGGRGSKSKAPAITKKAIFHYVYAVLHDPLYREKYAQNLKREFPRIPLYPDFWQWAAWGKTLMDLHIGYEEVEPWPLKRVDIPDENTRKNGCSPKAMLKADKEAGRIVLDSETSLLGIPDEAWDYKLGNRCALEWILDQYKEKTPKDPTIRARFNTYRFADHKDKVIDLLMRVTRVSVETEVIVKSMEAAPRLPD